METSIKFVEEAEDLSHLADYLPAVKEVTLVRLLKQVSQVYQSVCFKRLLELAPFSNSFELERVIVDCVRHNGMQIRVDHRTRTVHFGTDLTEAQSYTAAEGPHLQVSITPPHSRELPGIKSLIFNNTPEGQMQSL